MGEDKKMAVHAEECHSAGILFTPFVVEALGGWGEGATHTIRRIGRLQGQRLGINPAESTCHLFQRLFVALWRGNPVNLAAACSPGGGGWCPKPICFVLVFVLAGWSSITFYCWRKKKFN